MAGSPGPHRPQKQVREETRRILEAFLQGALSPRDAGPPGHVGRTYHDPQSYIHRSPTEHAPHCPAWTSIHEEINHAEERKHNFRTSIKKLLRRKPSPRTPPDGLPPSKGSLKRSKSGGEGGAHQKRSFSFKSLLKKKGASSGETGCPAEPGQRPDSLPVSSCYCEQLQAGPPEPQTTNNEAEETEFYTLVAQKLDHLVKQQQLISPSAGKGLPSPADRFHSSATNAASGISVDSFEPQGGTNEKRKEQVLQKLVALLEEQAGIINKEIEADPLLRNTISRLSYRSFSRMAEVFTSRSPPGIPSPQLAKLALTMELTRKVAGINSHAVHTLMGYSLQYMDMFVPWLQQQGGWENIVAQDEIFDVQID
uniref:bcl-2-like protein 12 n=1 Tax=Euleptes europaea TaxID=460621 RepID=UPI0025400C77|nr:bcl-2-like protein 12 [Euleptes europaea]